MIEIRELVLKAQVNKTTPTDNVTRQQKSKYLSNSEAEFKSYLEKLNER